MTDGLTPGTAVLVLALLASSVVVRRLLAGARTLPDVPPGATGPGSAVSVVVPARDEEATLPALLASLRALARPPLEVLVVDDGSRDATAAVAAAGGARVLPAGQPPSGWTGKAWACATGARAATGETLLFLDADTTLGPRALDGLLAVHAREGGLVSVAPHHDAIRPHEQLSAYFNAVSVLASGAFARGPARRPMAFGMCLLTSRADYDRVGGHGVVRGAVLDDVGLATAYDRAGLPVRCLLGGDAVRMRSYPAGLRQLADGWGKNIASGAGAAAAGPALGTVLWVATHHAVAVGAVLAAAALAAASDAATAASALLHLLAWLVVAVQLRWVLRRVGCFRAWTWAVFPLPLLAFDAIFARSAVATGLGRSVRWRGRRVRVDRRPRSSG